VSDHKHALKQTNDPQFYRCFEVATTLPGTVKMLMGPRLHACVVVFNGFYDGAGPSQLHVEAWDRDEISPDDFIGKTVIDLEDRWFDKRWQAIGQVFQTPKYLAPKPVERRPLFIPTRSTSQGVVSMWVDIMDAPTGKKYKIVRCVLVL